ncbi:MAG: FliM/FliN family flagellar motor switch protein [SAR324 cluster bacterium]|nr:FliM/FliN family flagellar motor switch protein [SAR324 cluster bacterium]
MEKKGEEILNKEEIAKLDDLDWGDLDNEIKLNKELVRDNSAPTSVVGGSSSSGTKANTSIKPVDKIDLSFLHDVPLTLYVDVGTRKIILSEVLSYDVGSVVELDSSIGQPLNIYVNNVLIGMGTIVERSQKYGVEIVELLDEESRLEALSAKAFAKV